MIIGISFEGPGADIEELNQSSFLRNDAHLISEDPHGRTDVADHETPEIKLGVDAFWILKRLI